MPKTLLKDHRNVKPLLSVGHNCSVLQDDATIGVGGGYPHLVIVQQELVVQVEVDVGNCEWTVLGRVLLKEV